MRTTLSLETSMLLRHIEIMDVWTKYGDATEREDDDREHDDDDAAADTSGDILPMADNANKVLARWRSDGIDLWRRRSFLIS